jgi:cell division septation protein DedD
MEKDSSAAFTIQIGGYADRANAQQVARRIRRAEETVFVRPEQQKGRTLYRVWVGRYETRSAAARRLDAVGDYTGSAFVTRMGEAP